MFAWAASAVMLAALVGAILLKTGPVPTCCTGPMAGALMSLAWMAEWGRLEDLGFQLRSALWPALAVVLTYAVLVVVLTAWAVGRGA